MSERYEYLSNVGEGAYGQVMKCKDKQTDQVFALKRFKDAPPDAETMRIIRREIRMLKACCHPNVVTLHEAFQSRSGRVYMVMEHVDYTLTERLKELSPKSVKLITWQLLQATAFLHSNRIIHRDLKPANILLSEDGKVKLCDFGFARPITPADTATYTQYMTTRWYRAPELLVGGAYGTPADIWSIGCLLGEMLAGKALLPGRDTLDQVHFVMRAVGPLAVQQQQQLRRDAQLRGLTRLSTSMTRSLEERTSCSDPDTMQVVRACLNTDPGKRLTALQVMALPYFDDVFHLLAGTELQQSYDQAYTGALAAGSSYASCFRSSTTTCLAMRAEMKAAATAANVAACKHLLLSASPSYSALPAVPTLTLTCQPLTAGAAAQRKEEQHGDEAPLPSAPIAWTSSAPSAPPFLGAADPLPACVLLPAALPLPSLPLSGDLPPANYLPEAFRLAPEHTLINAQTPAPEPTRAKPDSMLSTGSSLPSLLPSGITPRDVHPDPAPPRGPLPSGLDTTYGVQGLDKRLEPTTGQQPDRAKWELDMTACGTAPQQQQQHTTTVFGTCPSFSPPPEQHLQQQDTIVSGSGLPASAPLLSCSACSCSLEEMVAALDGHGIRWVYADKAIAHTSGNDGESRTRGLPLPERCSSLAVVPQEVTPPTMQMLSLSSLLPAVGLSS